VDFEDGFGPRSDEEEDREAQRVAEEVVRGMRAEALPRGFGIRVKALERATAARALRTLELVVGGIARGAGALPRGFVVTLPKVREETEVTALADALTFLEGAHGLPPGSLALELMVETPEALVSHGRLRPRALVDAARGRCAAVHLGAYDLTARLGVGARDQRLGHPYCALARQVLALELQGTGVAVSDGATTRLPVPPHRGAALDEAQREANALAVRAAWRAHADNVSEALRVGIDRGWDLHPGQLPARFAALFLHHQEGFRDTCARLRAFLARGAGASLHQGLMDDAATGQGLLNAVLRAVDCGAVAEAAAAEGVGCSVEALRGRSFGDLVRGASA
jgi:citrate lyase beta subunit